MNAKIEQFFNDKFGTKVSLDSVTDGVGVIAVGGTPSLSLSGTDVDLLVAFLQWAQREITATEEGASE